jgi:hypothetical protein
MQHVFLVSKEPSRIQEMNVLPNLLILFVVPKLFAAASATFITR